MVQVCAIIIGMLFWGAAADWTGRKWGSRAVAGIMLSGCILLTASSYAPSATGYFALFLVAQAWYGIGKLGVKRESVRLCLCCVCSCLQGFRPVLMHKKRQGTKLYWQPHRSAGAHA
jgi:hypothetical protein